MNYHLSTHCPNCFKSSPTAICPHCHFDRDKYLKEHASNHHLPLFTRLDKGYVMGRVLGEGGFAIVYAALREADGLAFAVKEYYPESLASRGLNNCTVQAKRNETERLAVWQKRFKEEAEHLRRCQDYPAIAGVVKRADLLEQNNTVYLVMERLQGNSLRDFLTEPKSAQWILGWLKPLLATFEQLHNRQIFHRDVSPNNVFLTAENQPVLMDFGLAREGIRDSVMESTAVGAGTPNFISPEQIQGGKVDAKTDLYSLGGVIYTALHGELPPSAGLRAQGARLTRCQNIDNVTAYLEKLAWHCLALDRDKRPENVTEIKQQYALLWQIAKSEETIVPDFQPIHSPKPTENRIGKFIVQKGIAVDTETELIWLRFAHGQSWRGDTIIGKAIRVNWKTAFDIAMKFNREGGYAGFKDWRLPTIDELKSLIDKIKGKSGNYIDENVFSNNYGFVWSSSPYAYGNGDAWIVNFSSGNDSCSGKNNSYAVRLVRDGK